MSILDLIVGRSKFLLCVAIINLIFLGGSSMIFKSAF